MLPPPLEREGAAGRRGAGEARAANAEEGVGAGAVDAEAGVAGAGTEREERVERKELTGGPHCHVSTKPPSKTAGWSIMNGFHT